ncbi:MAG: DNA damage-inducible protein D [Candidatus Gracilibacteria bacterium]|jgi:DNA-damage-inducible protein D
MKKELIQSLTENFESHAHQTEQGVEFWFARDLQQLLGYEKWDNFLNVISKAKTACEISKHNISDHFADVGKKVSIGSGAETDVLDIMLTRYACYLIAQNGDPRKEQIAFAQNYFAVQTRKLEVIEQRIKDYERLSARQKLTFSEKELSELIFEKTGDDKNFAIIRSKGDAALFGGYNTSAMKKKLGVSRSKPLADFLPTITIKAKDFAAEITVFNAKDKDLQTEKQISNEHIKNNRSVRGVLLERGIKPEELPPDEDVKKLERRLKSDDKKSLKKPLK